MVKPWWWCMQIIHMDLKSKNILLNRDHTLAKIADVGLSRGTLHTHLYMPALLPCKAYCAY